MKSTFVRRIAVAVVAPLLIVASACGSDDDKVSKSPDAVDGGKVTIVSQQFPEADIMTELYSALLTQAANMIMEDYPIIPLLQYSMPRLVKWYVGGYSTENTMDHFRSKDFYIVKH